MLEKLNQKIREKMICFMNLLSSLSEDNSGIGVVEVILILVVLIGLVVIFRDQLTTIINGIFERIVNDSNAI